MIEFLSKNFEAEVRDQKTSRRTFNRRGEQLSKSWRPGWAKSITRCAVRKPGPFS